MARGGALRRPGLIIGAFAIGYGVARSICELFRQPDAQLGFLWGGLTMGIILCVPLVLAGIIFIVMAIRRDPHTRT
jgi:phosphatidylglycerol:prolipoprotein diacylglycerol transferase